MFRVRQPASRVRVFLTRIALQAMLASLPDSGTMSSAHRLHSIYCRCGGHPDYFIILKGWFDVETIAMYEYSRPAYG